MSRDTASPLRLAAAAAAAVIAILLCGAAPPSDATTTTCPVEKPNIIFILLDDAGWYDFQSQDSLMATPKINKLKREGMFLQQSYVLPMCAPTRAALLTGRYPHTFGAQNGKAAGTDKLYWVNETFKFMSNEMKELNYTTHMLGKWHLGYCHPSLTPLGRGFDTFYGFVLGAHGSHYDHTKGSKDVYDWWDNGELDMDAKGRYSTDLLNTRAVEIIENSCASQPFFMYLAYSAPHGPFEVPAKYIKGKCNNSELSEPRRIHCGMMYAIDKGIGNIMRALEDKGTYSNTVILVMTDNGGPVGKDDKGSSNHPLRGGKKTVYEGGTRAYTVLKAPCLSAPGKKYKGLIHAVDWLPTLVAMAGGQNKPYMHGYNVWDSIRNNSDSPRQEMLYTRDDYEKFNHSASRYKHWKLIQGKPGFHQGWYPPRNEANITHIQHQYDPMTEEFYNVQKDPGERNNLINSTDETILRKLRLVRNSRDEFMKNHPLQPFKEPDTSDAWYYADKTTGSQISICWCHPAGTENDTECPLSP